MEQAQEAGDPEQVEAVAAWAVEAVAGAGAAVSPQVREATAFVPIVVKEQPINWALHVMSSNVRNAEPP